LFHRLSLVFNSDKLSLPLAWMSRGAVLDVLASYLSTLIGGNWGLLINPDLQNDDARTIMFRYHQYAAADALGDDPIANEMLSLVPWGVRLLYLAFVPIFDVYVASKLVQAVALGVLLYAAVVLARSRRTGLGAAALLLFFLLHTPYAVDRIGGGLPRAFGFPCFALWLAGVLAGKRGPRFSAPVILAFTYPSIMNLILAAEGLMALRGIGRIQWGIVGRRLRRYALLVGVCIACVLPAAMGDADRGPIHTLEQAQAEPAFGRSGRLWILPFAKPVDAMRGALSSPLKVRGGTVFPSIRRTVDGEQLASVRVLAGFLLLPFLRWVPPPAGAVSLFAGATVFYARSRIF